MRIKSKCLVCQGAGSKMINGVAHECLGCRGYGFVFVNYISNSTPEDNRRTLNIRTPSNGLTEKILQAVEQHQAKYFETMDIMDIRPMVLKDIADATGAEIPTISVHLKNKKIKDIDVKSLFSKSVSGMSNKVIKHIVAQIIEKDRSLSDSQVVEVLKEKQITVSRRTVSKYRLKMGLSRGIKIRKS